MTFRKARQLFTSLVFFCLVGVAVVPMTGCSANAIDEAGDEIEEAADEVEDAIDG